MAKCDYIGEKKSFFTKMPVLMTKLSWKDSLSESVRLNKKAAVKPDIVKDIEDQIV